jgi:hypothetical protein
VWDDADDATDRLKWRWSKGAATDVLDFMNPPGGAATYDLCVYDASGRAQPLVAASIPGGARSSLPGGGRWKATGRSGYQYASRSGMPRGITKARLKAGRTGKAQIKIWGKGVNLPTPRPMLLLPVTVQLVVSDGVAMHCWQTTYTAATINEPGRFRAKGP